VWCVCVVCVVKMIKCSIVVCGCGNMLVSVVVGVITG
jgi:hypothetical protein